MRPSTLSPSHRTLRLGLPAALGFLLLASSNISFAAAHAIEVDPVPVPCLDEAQQHSTGITARPADGYLTPHPDHTYLHSGTNLQGQPAYEKFAAGLFWFPPAPAELASFQSVVVVTNPFPSATANVTVDFFDQVGNPVGSSFFVLVAEATRVVIAQPLLTGPTATPGLGSARITSTGAPIVGETVHHAGSVDLSGFGGSLLTDPEPFNLGLNSLQQLQMSQAGKSTLWYGPMPFSTTAPLEFLSGNAPMLQIMNPNPTPTTITLSYTSRNGTIFPGVTVTIPAFGSHLDLTLWNSFLPSYLAGPVVDDDFRVVVGATQPILGDALMIDLFGGTGSLSAGKRFRMGSAMMANTPGTSLVNADLTFETTSPGVDTMVGLFNPTTGNVGPVNIRYFDRNGALIGADNIASFPRGALARIGPGLPASPNYPAAPVFAGWMQITPCKAGLVGWTMRQGGEHTVGGAPKKTWGEELTGANGLEPGLGFAVVVASQSFTRKVAPLVRAWPTGFWWPGYTTWVNDRSANAGPYWFRFFDHPGVDRTNAAGPPPQPFGGLRFGATSYSSEDPLVLWPSGPINLSGRVDASTTPRGFDGIHVIGDPLIEWGIFNGGDD
ncbi:MAG TPA: hypothetical protein VN851_28075 [Thermoanaerobaculia bacterium]|nr:hypothetical protein [Thermoanaerobaculia bacterium]